MPTFFEGFKRLLTGQPVFKEGEGLDGVEHKADTQLESQVEQGQQPSVVEATMRQGPKLIPAVIVQRVESRNSGADMDVSMSIENTSTTNVMLDKIMLFGNSRALNHVLKPGEEREFPVYNGPRLDNRNYTSCELQYRDEATGDYFSSVHFVEFEQESDNTYVIRRIRFVPPVKDI